LTHVNYTNAPSGSKWQPLAGSVRHDCRNGLGEHPMSAHDDPNEKIPLMQQLLDNPFLLLFIGVLVPMVVYTLWGVIDILTIPVAK
jgi:hypothetical protein